MDNPLETLPLNVAQKNETNSRWRFLKDFKKRWEKSPVPQAETPPEVQEARNSLIDKILKEGLKSSQELTRQGGDFFGSHDKNPNQSLYGRVLQPKESYRNPQQFQNAVDQVLYTGDNSCLPVVVERPWESAVDQYLFQAPKAEKDRFSEKAASSFLVITKATGINTFDIDSNEVKPEDFISVIFPQQILSDFNPEKMKQLGIPFQSVSQDVKRRLMGGDEISVPDYETTIKTLVTQVNSPIWIHAVRLPVAKDLEMAKNQT